VPGRIRVCLILEGTYPYVTGGVSAWVHDLVTNLPELDFALYTISPRSDQTVRYPRLTNIVDHKDVVLPDRQRGRPPRAGQGTLMPVIKKLHRSFATGEPRDLAQLLELVPAGRYLYDLPLRGEEGWQMVVEANQAHNPIYPFSEYYWAWRTAHTMMFTVLGTPAPHADLYHAVSTGYAGLAGTVAALRSRRPLILTEHGLYHKEREMEILRSRSFRGYQRDMWTGMFDAMSRLTYRASHRIIALFEYNRRKQIELGAPADRTAVIPNGIDVERYAAIERRPRPGYHVGLVGRVVAIKDIKTFILACKVISTRIPDARFHCIGPTDEEPAYYEDCRQLVTSLKMDDRFLFAGRQDVRDYYAFLDVLVLTSVREAQPLVILEAFAAGIPVVSTSVGNVGELLDYNERLLAPQKDAGGIATGVLHLHDHPEETRDLVSSYRRKVKTFYDRRVLFETYDRLYRETVTTWPA
jgi:glycosyltransferase involved in cell wall biosynthesis